MYYNRHRSSGPYPSGAGYYSRGVSGSGYGRETTITPRNPSLQRVINTDYGLSDRSRDFGSSFSRLSTLRPPPLPSTFSIDTSPTIRRRDFSATSGSVPSSPSSLRKHTNISDTSAYSSTNYSPSEELPKKNYNDDILFSSTIAKPVSFFNFSMTRTRYSSIGMKIPRRTDYSEYFRPVLQERPIMKSGYIPRSREERANACTPIVRERKLIKFRETTNNLSRERRRISWDLPDEIHSPLINQLKEMDSDTLMDTIESLRARSRESSLSRTNVRSSPHDSPRNSLSKHVPGGKIVDKMTAIDIIENHRTRQRSLTRLKSPNISTQSKNSMEIGIENAKCATSSTDNEPEPVLTSNRRGSLSTSRKAKKQFKSLVDAPIVTDHTSSANDTTITKSIDAPKSISSLTSSIVLLDISSEAVEDRSRNETNDDEKISHVSRRRRRRDHLNATESPEAVKEQENKTRCRSRSRTNNSHEQNKMDSTEIKAVTLHSHRENVDEVMSPFRKIHRKSVKYKSSAISTTHSNVPMSPSVLNSETKQGFKTNQSLKSSEIIKDCLCDGSLPKSAEKSINSKLLPETISKTKSKVDISTDKKMPLKAVVGTEPFSSVNTSAVGKQLFFLKETLSKDPLKSEISSDSSKISSQRAVIKKECPNLEVKHLNNQQLVKTTSASTDSKSSFTSTTLSIGNEEKLNDGKVLQIKSVHSCNEKPSSINDTSRESDKTTKASASDRKGYITSNDYVTTSVIDNSMTSNLISVAKPLKVDNNLNKNTGSQISAGQKLTTKPNFPAKDTRSASNESVKDKLPAAFEDKDEKSVKNITITCKLPVPKWKSKEPKVNISDKSLNLHIPENSSDSLLKTNALALSKREIREDAKLVASTISTVRENSKSTEKTVDGNLIENKNSFSIHSSSNLHVTPESPEHKTNLTRTVENNRDDTSLGTCGIRSIQDTVPDIVKSTLGIDNRNLADVVKNAISSENNTESFAAKVVETSQPLRPKMSLSSVFPTMPEKNEGKTVNTESSAQSYLKGKDTTTQVDSKFFINKTATPVEATSLKKDSKQPLTDAIETKKISEQLSPDDVYNKNNKLIFKKSEDSIDTGNRKIDTIFKDSGAQRKPDFSKINVSQDVAVTSTINTTNLATNESAGGQRDAKVSMQKSVLSSKVQIGNSAVTEKDNCSLESKSHKLSEIETNNLVNIAAKTISPNAKVDFVSARSETFGPVKCETTSETETINASHFPNHHTFSAEVRENTSNLQERIPKDNKAKINSISFLNKNQPNESTEKSKHSLSSKVIKDDSAPAITKYTEENSDGLSLVKEIKQAKEKVKSHSTQDLSKNTSAILSKLPPSKDAGERTLSTTAVSSTVAKNKVSDTTHLNSSSPINNTKSVQCYENLNKSSMALEKLKHSNEEKLIQCNSSTSAILSKLPPSKDAGEKTLSTTAVSLTVAKNKVSDTTHLNSSSPINNTKSVQFYENSNKSSMALEKLKHSNEEKLVQCNTSTVISQLKPKDKLTECAKHKAVPCESVSEKNRSKNEVTALKDTGVIKTNQHVEHEKSASVAKLTILIEENAQTSVERNNTERKCAPILNGMIEASEKEFISTEKNASIVKKKCESIPQIAEKKFCASSKSVENLSKPSGENLGVSHIAAANTCRTMPSEPTAPQQKQKVLTENSQNQLDSGVKIQPGTKPVPRTKPVQSDPTIQNKESPIPYQNKQKNVKLPPVCPTPARIGLFVRPKAVMKPVRDTIPESSSSSEDESDGETPVQEKQATNGSASEKSPDKEERTRSKSQISDVSFTTTCTTLSESTLNDLSSSPVRSSEKSKKLKFRKYTIEDFTFLKLLGKGSFGKVMLAELKDHNLYFAIKCLKKDVVLEDDDVESTMIERRILALGTEHPFMCKLYCTFHTKSYLFFAMEYLNGGDLMFHIQESGRFPENRAMFYAAEITSALKFLHKRGIVYRDLKVDNVILDKEGHVHLVDFGMCKTGMFMNIRTSTFCGTPDYFAPEILMGQKYNQSVDWWSFGVLLYEMLTGRSPFNGTDEDELFWSICNEEPLYPCFLTKEARQILGLILDKTPSKRLGMPLCLAGEIQDHAFFNTINWEKLYKKQIEPPFKPTVLCASDTSNFDSSFTMDSPKLSPVDCQMLETMDQEQFKGFSYTNPYITG